MLSENQQSLLVADTGKFRIMKVPVQGNAPAHPLLENLPGYPDNLMRGQGGKIWAGLVKPRNPDVDQLAEKPFMRKLILRLPRSLWPIAKDQSHVFAFTEDGKVVADLQDPAGAYPESTGVTETAERLYVQSLHGKTLACMPRPAK